MPRFKVPTTFIIIAADADDAADRMEAWRQSLGPALQEEESVEVGDPELIPEVMDENSPEFQRGYQHGQDWLANVDGDRKVPVAYQKLQELQIAGSQFEYGLMRACQEVIDEARRQANGHTGFGAAPGTTEAARHRILIGGW